MTASVSSAAWLSRALAVLQEPLDLRRQRGPGVEPHPAAVSRSSMPDAALVVAGPQGGERLLHVPTGTRARPRAPLRDRLVDDEQDRLEGSDQLGGVDGGVAASGSSTRPRPVYSVCHLGSVASPTLRKRHSCVLLVHVFPVLGRLAVPAGPSSAPATRPARPPGRTRRPLTVELQQREEATDHLQRRRAVRDEAERRRARAAQPLPQDRHLLADAHLRARGRGRRRPSAPAAARAPAPRAGELHRGQPEQHLGQQRGEARLEIDRAPVPTSCVLASSLRYAAASLYARYCSSRANSRSRASSSARSSSSSTSAAGSSRAVFRSSRVAATTRNSVAWPRSHRLRRDVGDELVGHLRQRDLGDVELAPADQAEQQVERALEVVQPHAERAVARPVPRRRRLDSERVDLDGVLGRRASGRRRSS